MSLVLTFILVLGPLVFVHEFGHFTVAKAVGVKVHEFALGMGPAIFKRRWGETVYSIRLLPLGGFTKLAGMDEPEDESDRVGADDSRNFMNKPLWQRVAVILAGPVMNFLLAAALLTWYFAFVVLPPTVQYVVPDSPAASAGLQVGDVILAVDRQPVRNVADLNRVVREKEGVPLELLIKRDGTRQILTAVPAYDPDTKVVRLGISLVQKDRLGLSQALPVGVQRTYEITRDLIAALFGMVTGRARAEISGPIGIFQVVGQSAQRGGPYLLFITAVLSVNLGLFNLLPIPVLDGGWITLFAWEALRGKPVAPQHKGIAQLIGLALLVALALFATIKDLIRLFPPLKDVIPF